MRDSLRPLGGGGRISSRHLDGGKRKTRLTHTFTCTSYLLLGEVTAGPDDHDAERVLQVSAPALLALSHAPVAHMGHVCQMR